jgi:hypothetical protein
VLVLSGEVLSVGGARSLVAAAIEVRVLGPLQVLVDGEDVTEHLSVAQRSVVALLAGAQGPVAKADVCRIVGLSPKSIDPLLSKLRGPLRTARPLHRSRTPGPGFMSLDPELVHTDVDAYLAAVEAGAEAHARGDDAGALRRLLDAEALWRGAPFDGVDLLDPPESRTSVRRLAADLLAASRRCRELASWCWIAGSRDGLDGARLRAWAEELRDVEACWSAATRAALEQSGAEVAAGVLARWRERASIDEDAAATGAYALVAGLVHGRGRGRLSVSARTAEMLERAEAAYLAGDWDDAERIYVAAAEDARSRDDVVAEAEVSLVMARLTWDPSRFEGALEARMRRLLDALPPRARLVRARVLACLAGGLYQDGSVGAAGSTAFAREALELVGELDDPLTEAEVLSHARKALIDIDPPEVQIERARRICSLARGSDYHRSLGLMAAVVDLLLMARVDEARAETEAYRRIAERTGSGFHRYHVTALDGMWALHDGRHDDVARLTAEAEALAQRFGGLAVAQVIYGQRLMSAYERGDRATLRALLPLVDAVAGVATPLPVWELTGAMVVAALGDDDEAARRFTAVAASTHDFADLPRGPLRIAALAAGALAWGELTSRGLALPLAAGTCLRAQLVDHSARGVLLGWPAVYLGPKQPLIDLLPAPS